MSILVIDLQSGFSKDIVVIRVDGQTVFKTGDVSTDDSIGRAASVETEVSADVHTVEVVVESRGLSGNLHVTVSETLYLGVSIEVERFMFRLSEESFLYHKTHVASDKEFRDGSNGSKEEFVNKRPDPS